MRSIARLCCSLTCILAFTGSLTAQTTGTSHRGVANPQHYKPKYENPVPGKFPISAWGLYDHWNTRSNWFKEAADCGINLGIFLTYDLPTVKEALQRAEGTGLQLLTVITNPQHIRQIRNSPALGGYFMADEPKVSEFANLRKLRDGIYGVDTTRLVMINIFPWTAPSVNGASSYQDYVRQSVSEIGLPVLSYDNYPIHRTDHGYFVVEDFYQNLEFIADVARKNGIPFWAYGQVMGDYANFPTPTAETLTFEVFNALAYGAQGITYYTYSAYGAEGNEVRTAPFNEKGERTKVWFALQRVNREIQNLTDIFLGCEAVGVWHTGEIPQGTHRLTSMPANLQSFVTGQKGVLLSHLRNNGKDYLMMVNHDANASQTIRMSWKGTLIRHNGDGSTRIQRGSVFSLPACGYAVFEVQN